MRRTAALLLAVVTAACVRVPTAQQTEGEGPGDALTQFADEYFNAYFTFYPTQGTAAGLHRYDASLEPWSASRIQNRIFDLVRQESSIEQIRRQRLSKSDEIDSVILVNKIRAELLDLQTIRWWRHNPLMYAVVPGAAIDGLIKRDFDRAPDRLRSVNARLRLVPAFMESMRNNIGECPREFVELSIRVVRGSIPFFRDELPRWAAEAAGADRALMGEFTSALRAAVAGLEVAAKYLENDLLVLSEPGFAIGADAFAKKLEYEEMVDIPLPRLLEIGEKNLAKDYQAFVETARRVQGGRSPVEAKKALAAHYPTEAELIGFASATAENIRKFVVERKIVPIPSEVRATILPSPAYLRAGGFAYMDTPGPMERKATEAFYYITPPESDWSPEHKEQHLRLFNRPVMDIITIHEAYPGHYVQFLYAKQFPTRVRKLVTCSTNVEGWAHYAEQMMVEQGFSENDPRIRLAQLSEALIRDVRYVAGIRIHTQGMSAAQAQRLFMDKAFMDEGPALEEARRGLYDPIYLYYTLGKLQIYKLRADYEKAKGSAYSIGGFHAEFMKHGAIPLKLMRRLMLPGDASPSI